MYTPGTLKFGRGAPWDLLKTFFKKHALLERGSKRANMKVDREEEPETLRICMVVIVMTSHQNREGWRRAADPLRGQQEK